jgi:hypothetical protein
VRAASFGSATPGDEEALRAIGLLRKDNADLSGDGRAFEDAFWVYDQRDTAIQVLRHGAMRLPVAQAIMQGLNGRPPVPVGGVHHLLVRHGLVAADAISDLRTFLLSLNALGIVAYSKKLQTVRLLVPLPEAADSEIEVIEPDRPYSNVLALRELLRACEEHIWWAEPHLGRKALEPLVYEADATRVTEIRLLSGPAQVDDPARKDWHRFKKELAARGITCEWRVVPTNKRDWHDRYIVGRRQAWNLPPLNTLYKGDYSEIWRTASPPPFERWWREGTPV